MQLLTEKQRNFVMAMVTHPGLADWQYAELAGYSKASGQLSLRVEACRLLQRKDINDAINECAGMRLRAGALVAAEVLVKLASDVEMSAGMRLRAAQALLDRVGLAPMQNIQVDHVHTDRTGAALMERIRELAKKHGIDPQKLLAGDVSRGTEGAQQTPAPLELKVSDV